MLVQVKYKDARDKIKAGDVIAFGGKGAFSNIIKFGTNSPVSHVGVVMRQERDGEEMRNLLIESTSLDGGGGVSTSFLSASIDNYDGEVWWLPLRTIMSYEQYGLFFGFLLDKVGREYDMKQAVKSALDLTDAVRGPGYNEEDFSKLFCSELVSGALEASGIIPSVNASEVTPADLVSWDIYTTCYGQLKGEEKEIESYNSKVIE